MMQEFSENDLYPIDLSYLNSPSELVYDLTSVLDNEQAKNRRIRIKTGSIDLNQAQLMSIKSLILSVNSSLAVLDGTSEITRASALATGIVYENSADMVPAETAFLNELQITEQETCTENTEYIHENVTEENCSEIQSENTENTEYVQGNIPEENYSEIQPGNTENAEEIPLEHSEGIPEAVHAENQQIFENNEAAEVQDNNNVTEQNEQLEFNQPDYSESVFQVSEEPQNFTENSEQNEEANEVFGQNIFDEEVQTSSPIPDNEEIQEKLNIIYGTEKKLEDIFESTGIKEEKFTSFKDIATAEEREYTKFDFELEAFPTKYLKQNICAGQVISFDGNLVIIGDCHEGSEISASGDITVWGDLSGSAYAGMNGNEKAKIRALRMNASQLRISTCFIKRPEALENPEITKKPFIPEEASINKGEIGVYKIFT